MDIYSLEEGLVVLEQDERLLIEINLKLRQDALDHIAFCEEFIRANRHKIPPGPLQARLSVLKRNLTGINTALFERLRMQIREGRYTPDRLRAEFECYTDYEAWKNNPAIIGTDGLDLLLDGILGLGKQFIGRQPPHPEMVHYEPTPARAILNLVHSAGLSDAGVLYDLGSGLGRVSILLNLLTGAPSKGVEIDPVLAAFARNLASGLQLRNVSFLTADAREADYSDGIMFFMFTSFLGSVLQTVLDKLKAEGRKRPILVCSYGASTKPVSEQDWLTPASGQANNEFSLVVFRNN